MPLLHRQSMTKNGQLLNLNLSCGETAAVELSPMIARNTANAATSVFRWVGKNRYRRKIWPNFGKALRNLWNTPVSILKMYFQKRSPTMLWRWVK